MLGGAEQKQVSVVLPVYMNADTIEELCTKLSNILEGAGYTHELIVVNDASPDRSGEVLETLSKANENLRVLSLPENVGQQRAIIEGLRVAKSLWVASMDADLQDPPEALPQLLALLGDGGHGAVFAGRRGNYQSAKRMLSSRVFKRLVSFITCVPADSGSYVVMTQLMVEKILSLRASRPYLVGMIGCCGLPVTSIPVTRLIRPSGSSAYSSLDRLVIGVTALINILRWRLGL